MAYANGKYGGARFTKPKASAKKPSSKPKKSQPVVKKTKARDLKPVSEEKLGIPLRKVTRIMVETGWLNKITLDKEGELDTPDSWIGFVLLLLSMTYTSHKDRFMSLLVDNGVLSDGVNLVRELIQHPTSSNIKYAIYKLGDSPYYVEFRDDGSDILKAIKGLLKINKVNPDDITFDILPMEVNVGGINTTFKDVKKSVKNETLTSLYRANNLDIKATSITLFGYKQEVKSTTQALVAFMTWAISCYGETLEKAGIKNTTVEAGLTDEKGIEQYGNNFTIAKIGKYYLFASNNNANNLRYMMAVMLGVGISPDLVSIEYTTLELI